MALRRFSRNVLVLLCTLSSLSFGQLLTGRLSTAAYTFERFDSTAVSNTILRGYQTLQLEARQDQISLHTYLLGGLDMKDDFGDNGTVRVYNLFLRIKNLGNVADVSLGRVPVFAGVGNGIVDGGILRFHPVNGIVTVTAYGGGNVRPALISKVDDGLENNFLLGGQIVGSVPTQLRAGVSYVNRRVERASYLTIRPDSLFNPIQTYFTPDSRAEQLIGGDVRYFGSRFISMYGRYDYDINQERSSRAEARARVSATNKLSVTGEFVYREPRIYYNSFLRVFPASPNREYQAGIEYSIKPDLQTFARVAYVKYSDDQSRRLMVGVNWRYGSIRFQGTNGYAGELSSVYAELMYPFFGQMLTPNVGFSFARYRQFTASAQQENILAGSLGAIVRPEALPVSFDVQVQWLQNPIYQNDTRFFGRLSYWFSHELGLFTGRETSESMEGHE